MTTKKALFVSHNGNEQGRLLTAVPLCFALSSQKAPLKVPTHPLDITVEPGQVYAAKQPSTNSSRNEFTDFALLHRTKTAALWNSRVTDTGFRSNAFMNYFLDDITKCGKCQLVLFNT